MSTYLIAVFSGGGKGFSVSRVVLPNDEYDQLAQDLRMNYSRPADALRICRDNHSWRGIPSEGVVMTDSESRVFVSIPPIASSYEELLSMAVSAEVDGVVVYDGGEWMRLSHLNPPVKLAELKLFSVQKSEK